jgi:hypothetical protein
MPQFQRKFAGCFRKPAVHFVVIGALLFTWQRLGASAPEVDAEPRGPEPILVSLEKLQALPDQYAKIGGREPNLSEEKPMIADFVDDEILYREALVHGLDRGDRSIKWRLVDKMRFLTGREDGDPDELYREAIELGLDRDDVILRRLLTEKMRLLIKLAAVNEEPTEAALQAFFDEHAEDYRQPARVTFAHVFLSSDKRGDRLEADAVALREQLGDEPPQPGKPVDAGDVFALGAYFKSNSENNLAKLFGAEFAAAAIRVEPGAWSQPIRSAYGMHLIWVDGQIDSRLPELGSVKNQVRQRYLSELRERALVATMKRLREKYEVQIEGRDGTLRASALRPETA